MGRPIKRHIRTREAFFEFTGPCLRWAQYWDNFAFFRCSFDIPRNYNTTIFAIRVELWRVMFRFDVYRMHMGVEQMKRWVRNRALREQQEDGTS